MIQALSFPLGDPSHIDMGRHYPINLLNFS